MVSLKVIVTGGAGFIGSHLVDRLISTAEVTVIDNLSSGSILNLERHIGSSKFSLITADLSIRGDWEKLFSEAEMVFHLAASTDVRMSYSNPRVFFRNNVVATFNVLEACRIHNVQSIIFTSSSTVYGDADVIPTPEDYQPLRPISIYGMSKLLGEKLIESYSRIYGIRALILRLANVIGPRSTHGVVLDFINKLMRDRSELEILGDGSQRKSYLHVEDTIDAIIHLANMLKTESKGIEVYNLGNEDWISVKEIADILVEEMGLKDVKYRYKLATRDGRGWFGDVKLMLLDISKLKDTGWKPRYGSRDAVRKTIKEILNNLQNP